MCSCGFKPNNAEWQEVIAAAVEAAMSGDGAITAQEVQFFSRWQLTPTCCGASAVCRSSMWI